MGSIVKHSIQQKTVQEKARPDRLACCEGLDHPLTSVTPCPCADEELFERKYQYEAW